MESRGDRLGLWLDRVAIALSGLCLVHCAGTAILVALLTTTSGALFGHNVHEIGLSLALTIGIIALGTGVCRHGAIIPLLVGAAGLLLMAAALAVPHGPLEAVFTMFGVSILAIGHHMNRKASRATLA